MAITTPGTPFSTKDVDPFEIDINSTDYAIGGKLIQARLVLNPLDEVHFQSSDEFKKAIKNKIASELARAMIESNLIEFTQAKNVDYSTVIHARCYLAPNDQVKILRIHNAQVR